MKAKLRSRWEGKVWTAESMFSEVDVTIGCVPDLRRLCFTSQSQSMSCEELSCSGSCPVDIGAQVNWQSFSLSSILMDSASTKSHQESPLLLNGAWGVSSVDTLHTHTHTAKRPRGQVRSKQRKAADMMVEVNQQQNLCPPLCALCLQIFQGNHNAVDEAHAFLPKQTLTRYIRIRPMSWEAGICMRFEIYGCRTSGNHDNTHTLIYVLL